MLGRRTYEDFYGFWPKQTGNPCTGRRLFPDGGGLARLRLTGSTATTTGVLIATYQARRDA